MAVEYGKRSLSLSKIGRLTGIKQISQKKSRTTTKIGLIFLIFSLILGSGFAGVLMIGNNQLLCISKPTDNLSLVDGSFMVYCDEINGSVQISGIFFEIFPEYAHNSYDLSPENIKISITIPSGKEIPFDYNANLNSYDKLARSGKNSFGFTIIGKDLLSIQKSEENILYPLEMASFYLHLDSNVNILPGSEINIHLCLEKESEEMDFTSITPSELNLGFSS